jgi:hypothetical protein
MTPVKDDDDEYGDQNRFYEDPELQDDETDPTYEAEVFDILRDQGVTPDKVTDKAVAKRYAKWLKTAPPE